MPGYRGLDATHDATAFRPGPEVPQFLSIVASYGRLSTQGMAMPIVHISLIEGREPAAISGCVKAVARAIHETLGAPLNSIRVIATMVPAAYWAVGDQTKDEVDTSQEAPAAADGAALNGR